MKKILSIILLLVLTCVTATIALSAAVSEPVKAEAKLSSDIMIGGDPAARILWKGKLYFPRNASYMVFLEDFERDYVVVAEIEASFDESDVSTQDEYRHCIVSHDFMPIPSADDKATSGFTWYGVGEKLYKKRGESDDTLYVIDKVWAQHQVLIENPTRTWLMPWNYEEDFIVLGAGIEDPLP